MAPGQRRSHNAYVALADAVSWLRDRELLTAEPLTDSVAAVSVGVVDGISMLDLCYTEDSAADTDMNVVMTGDGSFIRVREQLREIPSIGELLDELLDLAAADFAHLTTFATCRLRPHD